MKLLKFASALLASGLLTSFVFAEENTPRVERRSSAVNQGAFPAKNPEAVVQKMLSKFDSDGNNELNASELMKMFSAIRNRPSGARSTKGRNARAKSEPIGANQGRAGQTRPISARRTSGPKSDSNGQGRMQRAPVTSIKEGDSAFSSSRSFGQNVSMGKRGRHNQELGAEQESSPGGTRPTRPVAK